MPAQNGIVASLIASAACLAACSGAPDRPGPASAAATAAAVVETDPNPYPGTRRRKGRNGETLYCWDRLPTGSKIPKTVCATAEVMENSSSDARRAFDAMREQAGTTGGCIPSGGC